MITGVPAVGKAASERVFMADPNSESGSPPAIKAESESARELSKFFSLEPGAQSKSVPSLLTAAQPNRCAPPNREKAPPA